MPTSDGIRHLVPASVGRRSRAAPQATQLLMFRSSSSRRFRRSNSSPRRASPSVFRGAATACRPRGATVCAGLLDPEASGSDYGLGRHRARRRARLEVLRTASARSSHDGSERRRALDSCPRRREHVGRRCADAWEVEHTTARRRRGAIRTSHRALASLRSVPGGSGPTSVGRRTRCCCRVAKSTSFTSFAHCRSSSSVAQGTPRTPHCGKPRRLSARALAAPPSRSGASPPAARPGRASGSAA